MRKPIFASLVAAVLGGAALPAAAHSHIDFFVGFAPPPVRYEVLPAPRAGFVWAPGFWEWRHGYHYWVPGHWVRARPGYVYAPARWVPYGERWAFHRGAWVRVR